VGVKTKFEVTVDLGEHIGETHEEVADAAAMRLLAGTVPWKIIAKECGGQGGRSKVIDLSEKVGDFVEYAYKRWNSAIGK